MIHFYNEIHGWFDFENFYREMIDFFPSKSVFVEVGCWLGKSISFLTVESIIKNKRFEIYAIDTWPVVNPENTPEWDKTNLYLFGGSTFKCFCNNTKYILDIIHPCRCDSSQSSGLFEGKSVDFVFIDASHEYKHTVKDIESWLPKMKNGGILSGHDYIPQWPGVVRAVNETLGAKNVKKNGLVWYYNVIR